MIRRQYHYLISGLPGIFIGERLWTNLADFRAHLKTHLHPEDFIQVQNILLQQDHQNLLCFMETGDIPAGTAGNYTLENLRNPEDHVSGAEPESDPMPEYIRGILAQFNGDKEQVDKPKVQQELDEGFFRLIMGTGKDFLCRYYTFHYDLNNLLTFIKSGVHQLSQQKYISGHTPHAQHLREYAGRNLTKDPEFEYFDEILSVNGNPSFAEEEKNFDLLRWRVIDEMNLFEYFTIDRILGYLLQMMIADRWAGLRRESGEEKLRNLIDISLHQVLDNQLVQQASPE